MKTVFHARSAKPTPKTEPTGPAPTPAVLVDRSPAHPPAVSSPPILAALDATLTLANFPNPFRLHSDFGGLKKVHLDQIALLTGLGPDSLYPHRRYLGERVVALRVCAVVEYLDKNPEATCDEVAHHFGHPSSCMTKLGRDNGILFGHAPSSPKSSRANSASVTTHSPATIAAFERFFDSMSTLLFFTAREILRTGVYKAPQLGDSSGVLARAKAAGIDTDSQIRSRQLLALHVARALGSADISATLASESRAGISLSNLCERFGFSFDVSPDPTSFTLDQVLGSLESAPRPFVLGPDRLLVLSLPTWHLLSSTLGSSPQDFAGICAVVKSNPSAVLAKIVETKKSVLNLAHEKGIRYHAALAHFGLEPRVFDHVLSECGFTSQTFGKAGSILPEEIDRVLDFAISEAVRTNHLFKISVISGHLTTGGLDELAQLALVDVSVLSDYSQELLERLTSKRKEAVAAALAGQTSTLAVVAKVCRSLGIREDQFDAYS
ncbi:hypothetical protein HY990_03100 [Candidatus Micrarchaeota archaeon]|nr:hypothetical protein [Candidatus Micrarchaeota archaeon]